MENLKALVYKGDLTPYQKALAQREFEGLIERLELYEKAVKNNAILPHVSNLLNCDNCRYENSKYDKYCNECINFNKHEKAI